MKNSIISIHRFVMALKRPSKKTNVGLLAQRGESLSFFRIREVKEEDIPELAALHVKTWNETYWTTIHPPTYKTREFQWNRQFQITDGSWFCFVVENKNGQLVGFAKGQTYSHSDLPEFSGELNKIYLLRRYQHLGLGKRLMCRVGKQFIEKGIYNMVLFGTPENPSCRFHEAMGGEKLFAKNGQFHGGYCWRNLKKLSEHCSSE